MSDLTGGSGESESRPSFLDTLKLSQKAETFVKFCYYTPGIGNKVPRK